MTALLETHGLTVEFGGLRALSNASLSIREGEVLGIVGPNGAGKTTLFNAISGFVPLSGGSVDFAGEDITSAAPHSRVRRGLVRTFQATRDFEHLTVAEHLDVVSVAWRDTPSSLELVHSLGLSDHVGSYTADIPYGVRRDLGLLMALMLEPRCLLIDEPSSGLTDLEADRVASILRGLSERGMAVGVIDHNVGFIRRLASTVAVMNAGEIVEIDGTEAALNSEAVRKVYLGA